MNPEPHVRAFLADKVREALEALIIAAATTNPYRTPTELMQNPSKVYRPGEALGHHKPHTYSFPASRQAEIKKLESRTPTRAEGVGLNMEVCVTCSNIP